VAIGKMSIEEDKVCLIIVKVDEFDEVKHKRMQVGVALG